MNESPGSLAAGGSRSSNASPRQDRSRQDIDATPNIKVCARVRPFIQEEILRGDGCELCVQMPSSRHVQIQKPTEEIRTFEFDRSYWSHSEDDPHFSSQADVFKELGENLLRHSISGFNNCIFAYGQTASGKSYSQLGGKDGEDSRGLLPRIVQGLFEHFQDLPAGTTHTCLVSFMEIYNEQIRDLLTPSHLRRQSISAGRGLEKLEVRQHPVIGVFVHGLTEAAAGSCEEVLDLIEYGTTIRAVGATAMNQNSSRSHCIFTFKTTVSSCGHSRLSQTHLVDLAGSERSKRSGATGERLKEGAGINKTLSTLARVISALANRDAMAPFRDSKLTHILKESLCGNSKTVMIAALSPSLCDYEETLSTLRFAQSVKKVQTHAVVNEANEGDIEQRLRTEVLRLKEQLCAYELQKGFDQQQLREARSQLEDQEDLCRRYGDWDKALEAERTMQVQRRVLVTSADLSQVQERFMEMHNLETVRRRLSKEGVESASDEEWEHDDDDSHYTSGSESHTDRDAPVLVQMSNEASATESALRPRRLSTVDLERLRQGALVATAATAEDLAETLRQLKVDATEVESLANSVNPPGAPSVRLLAMVAVDPSESHHSHQTTALVAVVPGSSSSCSGSVDMLDTQCSVDGDALDEALEWLSEAELQSRLVWLQCAAEDIEQQRQIGPEGAWATCRRAVQGSPGLEDEVAQLRAQLARVRQEQQSEQERNKKEAAELRRQLEECSAELRNARRELTFSEQSRHELVIADEARRELEGISSSRRSLTFVPMERVEAPEGDVAAEIAASFRNALGALDQAQAALKGKRESSSPVKGFRHSVPSVLDGEKHSAGRLVRHSATCHL